GPGFPIIPLIHFKGGISSQAT
ncbi:hypothetical protein A2U01_0068528, partial [Trifolium medium]|nr:hypothetical protein [Trifolium medium]